MIHLSAFFFDILYQIGNQSGEALVALGMPGSYLTEGNIFLGRYRGRELINAIRLKSSSHDLKHKGFGLGYAIALAKLNNNNNKLSGQNKHIQSDDQQHFQSNINIITSSPMWIDNDYRGIIMILNQAMDLGGVSIEYSDYFLYYYWFVLNDVKIYVYWFFRSIREFLHSTFRRL